MDMQEDLKLTVKDVSAGYGNSIILEDISTVVHPGELVALIGPNGAGKSTLIKSICGLLPIKTGTVYVDGKNLLKMEPTERARMVSVIPQARNLPPAFTVREVVLMGRTAYVGWLGKTSLQDELIANQAMQRTNLLGLADRRMDELSGGEQQRVLVARAIAQQPRVLLLDEPTTHLDISYQMNLLELIATLAHQDRLAILMAIHDLNLAAYYADRVILLVKGRIIAHGSPSEVLTPEVLSSAYQVPLYTHSNGSKLDWISPF
jgi:iron complex transport system ATP-binding protein